MFYVESAKLRTLLAPVLNVPCTPRALVPYMSRAPRALVPYVPRALHTLVPYIHCSLSALALRILRALVPIVLKKNRIDTVVR